MPLDPTPGRGREVVSYVRVGRGMVKVTKYENEQPNAPKSPLDTISVDSSHSRSSSGHSGSAARAPSRSWFPRPHAKGAIKRTSSTHRSRSRSSGRSLHTVRRAGVYMRSDHDLASTSPEHRSTSREGSATPGRRARLEPPGPSPLNSLSIPGSNRPGGPSFDSDRNYPKSSPHPSTERGRGLCIIPPSSSTTPDLSASLPSPGPSTFSWTTESTTELDPVADSEMWSSISRLEDELVSRFGRGVVPHLTSLRHEKSPTANISKETRTLPPPAKDFAALQLERAAQNTPTDRGPKLKQRSFDPVPVSELPPRRVYRAKSSPALPSLTIPSWVTTTPLPAPPVPTIPPHRLAPSSAWMRAKAGPSPQFSAPPNVPPPPPPKGRHDRDMQKELEALVALYDVLEASYRSEGAGSFKGRSAARRFEGLRSDLGSTVVKPNEKGSRLPADSGGRILTGD